VIDFMKIVTADQMRQIEQRCVAFGIPTEVLMENAGRAVAEAIRSYADNQSASVVVLVGPGNNGGDGLVAGRYLRTYGFGVTLLAFGSRPVSDKNVILAREHGLEIVDAGATSLDRLERSLEMADIVVDAFLGIGKNRPISGRLAEILATTAAVRQRRPSMMIVALDIPSGVDADTGRVDPQCVAADETITLGFPKPGLFVLPGAGYAGRITIADIGIDPQMAGSTVCLITSEIVRPMLPKRTLISNKGSFGKAMIVAGSSKYIGAAYLACSGAMRVGAGLVTLATRACLLPVLAAKLTETTYLPLAENAHGELTPEAQAAFRSEITDYDAFLIGPGVGRDTGMAEFVLSILFDTDISKRACIIDADALNILCEAGKTTDVWRKMKGDAILTPHPGEMARLAGITVEQVQSDRINLTRSKAVEWQKTIVLKGAYTVIASPDGRTVVSPFANPGLASAGTGDVLAGVIAGFTAQKLPLFEAAVTGVFVHGKAGEKVAGELGNAGMIAGDLLPVLPVTIKSIKEG
jgi:ADP-dependent NAD(P)H-hydrate dehydratase / NAD(P)H-hydrate epimerase